METQTKAPLVATSDEVSPGIENVETLDEWQNVIDQNWDLAAQKAKKKLPMFVSYYGHSMRYWPHNGRVRLDLTDTVVGQLGRDYVAQMFLSSTDEDELATGIELNEEVADKLGIPYAELMEELAA